MSIFGRFFSEQLDVLFVSCSSAHHTRCSAANAFPLLVPLSPEARVGLPLLVPPRPEEVRKVRLRTFALDRGGVSQRRVGYIFWGEVSFLVDRGGASSPAPTLMDPEGVAMQVEAEPSPVG